MMIAVLVYPSRARLVRSADTSTVLWTSFADTKTGAEIPSCLQNSLG